MINSDVRPRLSTAVGVSGHSGVGAVNDVVRLWLEADRVCGWSHQGHTGGSPGPMARIATKACLSNPKKDA